MLVVDINALLAVRPLDFLDDIGFHRFGPAGAQDVLRREGAFGELAAALDDFALGDLDARAHRDLIDAGLPAFGIGDDDVAHGGLFGLPDLHHARDVRKDGGAFGLARLEQLFHARKTLGDVLDVVAGDAAGVEGAHGELGARFADGLGGDDADRFADADGLSGGQVGAVALRAYAHRGTAGQDRAGLHGGDAFRDDPVGVFLVHQLVLADEDLTGLGIEEIVHEIATEQAVAEGFDDRFGIGDLGDHDALLCAAVLFPDDHALRDVHQTAGQVARVGGAQRRVGQALAGAAGGDEVFQDRQAFAVVGLDRDLDGLSGGVGDVAAHAGELAELVHGAAGAGIQHHPDGVVAVEAVAKGVGHVVRGLFPFADGQSLAFVVGDESALELILDPDDLLLRLRHQFIFLLRDDDVRD